MSLKEIDAILQVVRKRDVAAARQAAITHIENAAASALGTETEPNIELPSEKATAAVRRKSRTRSAH